MGRVSQGPSHERSTVQAAAECRKVSERLAKEAAARRHRTSAREPLGANLTVTAIEREISPFHPKAKLTHTPTGEFDCMVGMAWSCYSCIPFIQARNMCGSFSLYIKPSLGPPATWQETGGSMWGSMGIPGALSCAQAGTYKKNKKIHSDEPLPIEACEVPGRVSDGLPFVESVTGGT